MADGADRKPLIDPVPCWARVDASGRFDRHGSRTCGGRVALPACKCIDCGARMLRPQPGPQTEFLRSPAFFALTGGAAGGGKTVSLLLDALAHGARSIRGWVGVVFRARDTDIDDEASIYAEAKRLFAGTDVGGKDPIFKESPGRKSVRWRGGGTLLFRHIGKENFKFYKGKQYAWIGFDEVTEIDIEHVIYMASRARSLTGVTPRVRATCNPDPDHDLARWVRPYLHLDPSSREYGTADRSKSGAIRYYQRSKTTNRIEFGDTPEECAEVTGQGLSTIRSFSFIPSLLADNAILEIVDPDYRANVESQESVTAEQLARGNWLIRRDTGGMLSRNRWGHGEGGIVHAPLAPIVKRVRGWDLAATKPRRDSDKAKIKDPDFTGGLMVEFDVDGRFYISGLAACREDTPERDKMIREVVARDGPHWTHTIPVDPAAGGKSAAHYQKANIESVRGHGPVVLRTPNANKVARAQPVADALERGIEVNGKREPAGYILDRDGWLARPYEDSGEHPRTLGELLWSHLDPFGTGSEKHDDIVDMLSDAHAVGAAPPSRRVPTAKRARQVR